MPNNFKPLCTETLAGCCRELDEEDIFNSSRFSHRCVAARSPARSIREQRHHRAAESSFNESKLFYRWQRPSDLSDGLAHVERFPGLGNGWFSPAFRLCGVCKDAGRAPAQLHAAVANGIARLPRPP